MHNLDATKRCLFSFYFKTAVFGIEFSLCTHSKRIKTWRRIKWKLLVDDKCLTMVKLIQLFLIIFKKNQNSRCALFVRRNRSASTLVLCCTNLVIALMQLIGSYVSMPRRIYYFEHMVCIQYCSLFSDKHQTFLANLFAIKRVNRMLCLWFMMQSNCY